MFVSEGNWQRIASIIVVVALAAVLQVEAKKPDKAELIPVMSETAPETFAVQLETSKGTVVVEAYRPWAPHAVDRFYNLVRSGYLNGNIFYDVRPGTAVEFGIHGDPGTFKEWRNSPILADRPERKIVAGDVNLMCNVFGVGAAVQIRVQIGPDGSAASRTGTTPFGRVVEGMEILDALDDTHMTNPRKAHKMWRKLQKDGYQAIRKDYPQLDSIVHARILDRPVEILADDAAGAGASTPDIPDGMALVSIYRNDGVAQKFTLRIDGEPAAVLKPGTFHRVMLPAGDHEFATKVKFKMFATGLLDKAFAGADKHVETFESGTVNYFRAVPAGADGRILKLVPMAPDFGAEECERLTTAKLLDEDEGELDGSEE